MHCKLAWIVVSIFGVLEVSVSEKTNPAGVTIMMKSRLVIFFFLVFRSTLLS